MSRLQAQFDGLADTDLFPHLLDVQRSTATKDSEHGPVETWVAVPGYQALKALVAPGGASEMMEWAQRGVRATHKVYIPMQVVDDIGWFPSLRPRDRLVFGTLPDGVTPRYLTVSDWVDEAESAVLLTVDALETKRPG